MAEDNQLQTLQEEIKLMKGELKQSLASVRDYLLNMELPSSEISNILATLNEGNQKVTMSGTLSMPADYKPPQDEITETEEEQELEDDSDEISEGDDLLELEKSEQEESDKGPENNLAGDDEELPEQDELVSPEKELVAPEDEISTPEDELPATEDELPEQEEAVNDGQDGVLMPEAEMFKGEEGPMQEEQPMQYDNSIDDSNLSVPKVNMLTNLIGWVARANREIGRDQLPIFLEVYGISGHLSPELKEVIIHLSEITENEPEGTNSAEVWAQSMLLLHGILTGGDSPLHPIIPAWNNEEKTDNNEEIIEIDKAKDKPVKLKLILPDSNGEEKEFCINLTPEADISD